MSTSQNEQIGSSGKKGAVYRRSIKRTIPSTALIPTFSKRMQVYAYSATTAILLGLLLGVGWLYKIQMIQTSDSVLMFILAQVLGVWVGLTNKIFRIARADSEAKP
jgi:hypothetical protein